MESSDKILKQISDLSRNLDSLVVEMKETNKQIRSSNQGIKESAESNKKIAESTSGTAKSSTENSDKTDYKKILKFLEKGAAEAIPLKRGLEAINGKNLKIPFLANGGEITKSGNVVVGEKGPEVVKLSKGDQVIPAEKGDPVKTLTALIEAWESKNTIDPEDKANIFESPKSLQEIIKVATGGKNGIGDLVPTKEEVDSKIKDLLTGKEATKFLNPDTFGREIDKFVKEKYGPYGMSLFYSPGYLGLGEKYKGIFETPRTKEQIEKIYQSLNEKSQPSLKEITKSPKLDEVSKSSGKESNNEGKKEPGRLKKLFGRTKEGEEKSKAGSSESISGESGLTFGQKLKEGAKEIYEKSAIGKSVSEVKSLLDKNKDSGGSSMKKEGQTLSKSPAATAKTQPSSTPETSSSPSTSPSSVSTSPSTPEASTKLSTPSKTSPSVQSEGISPQDIQDIKSLLSAINSTLNGPLTIKDNKPFRPKSSMLE